MRGGEAVAPASWLGARVGAKDEQGKEVHAEEPEEREHHRAAHDDLLVEVRRDLERIGRGRDWRDVVGGRLFERCPGRVVLLDDLGAAEARLPRLDLALVVDEEDEEREEAEEEQAAQHREDDVEIERHSRTSRFLGSQAFACRSMTLSGFVSTVRRPPASALMWKSWSGFGAGPPFTTAVCWWSWCRCAAGSLRVGLEALVGRGHGPRREDVHARPAHGRTDDREHEVHGDEAREDRDHPLARAGAVESLDDEHQQEGEPEHR